jgi:hypothetical protein
MYKCKFTAEGGAYSMEYYNLPSRNKKEIIEIIKSQGWIVIEVYDIKKQ